MLDETVDKVYVKCLVVIGYHVGAGVTHLLTSLVFNHAPDLCFMYIGDIIIKYHAHTLTVSQTKRKYEKMVLSF